MNLETLQKICIPDDDVPEWFRTLTVLDGNPIATDGHLLVRLRGVECRDVKPWPTGPNLAALPWHLLEKSTPRVIITRDTLDQYRGEYVCPYCDGPDSDCLECNGTGIRLEASWLLNDLAVLSIAVLDKLLRVVPAPEIFLNFKPAGLVPFSFPGGDGFIMAMSVNHLLEPPVNAGPGFFENLVCSVCGCSEMDACPGGCSWVGPGICSACVEE
jgi:hypothetical protein